MCHKTLVKEQNIPLFLYLGNYCIRKIRSKILVFSDFFFGIIQVVNLNHITLNNWGLSRCNFPLNCKFAPSAQSQRFIEWAVWFLKRKNNNKKNNNNRNTQNEWMRFFLPSLNCVWLHSADSGLWFIPVVSAPLLSSPSPAAICLKNAYISFCENSFLQGLH